MNRNICSVLCAITLVAIPGCASSWWSQRTLLCENTESISVTGDAVELYFGKAATRCEAHVVLPSSITRPSPDAVAIEGNEADVGIFATPNLGTVSATWSEAIDAYLGVGTNIWADVEIYDPEGSGTMTVTPDSVEISCDGCPIRASYPSQLSIVSTGPTTARPWGEFSGIFLYYFGEDPITVRAEDTTVYIQEDSPPTTDAIDLDIETTAGTVTIVLSRYPCGTPYRVALDLETESGTITLGNVAHDSSAPGSVRIKTVSGNIEVQTPDWPTSGCR